MSSLNDQITYCLATAGICSDDDMPEEEQMLKEIANSLAIFQNMTRVSGGMDAAVMATPKKESDH